MMSNTALFVGTIKVLYAELVLLEKVIFSPNTTLYEALTALREEAIYEE